MVTCRRTNRSPGQGFLNKSHVGRQLYSYPGVSEDKGTLIDFVSPLHLYLTKTWVLKFDPYWHFRYGHRMKLLTYTAHPSLTRDTRHDGPLKVPVLDQNQAWKRTLVCHSYFINRLYMIIYFLSYSAVLWNIVYLNYGALFNRALDCPWRSMQLTAQVAAGQVGEGPWSSQLGNLAMSYQKMRMFYLNGFYATVTKLCICIHIHMYTYCSISLIYIYICCI